MKAYKFTNNNCQPIYGHSDYPEIGVRSESRIPKICVSGWHVSNPNYLSKILGSELWEVQVEGQYTKDDSKSAWEFVTFVSKIDSWNLETIVEFAQDCSKVAAADAYAYAYANTAANAANAAAYAANAAAYAAAYAAAAYAVADAYAYANAAAANAANAAAYAAYAAAERKRQADWIIQRCGLSYKI